MKLSAFIEARQKYTREDLLTELYTKSERLHEALDEIERVTQPTSVPRDSALLKCEQCGNARRVWLNCCASCADPEANWYEKRMKEYEDIINKQDRMIRSQADQLNTYLAKVRDYEKKINEKDRIIKAWVNLPGKK